MSVTAEIGPLSVSGLPPGAVTRADAPPPKQAEMPREIKSGPGVWLVKPSNVTVTVSGNWPSVHAEQGGVSQQAEQLEPSMIPTGYIPAANKNSPHSTNDGGSTD